MTSALIGCGDRSSSSGSAEASVRVVSPSAIPPAAAPNDDNWADFPGPKIDLGLRGGDQVWAAIPLNNSWGAVKLSRGVVVGSADGRVDLEERVGVPSALVFRTPEGTVEKGQGVMVSAMGGTLPGRVVEVKDDTITAQVVFLGNASEEKVNRSSAIVLTGTIHQGAPVAYQHEEAWMQGTLLFRGESESWILSWGGKVVSAKNEVIKPVDVGTRHAEGATVRGAILGEFRKVEVLAAMDDGIRYRIKVDETEDTLAFTEVATDF